MVAMNGCLWQIGIIFANVPQQVNVDVLLMNRIDNLGVCIGYKSPIF